MREERGGRRGDREEGRRGRRERRGEGGEESRERGGPRVPAETDPEAILSEALSLRREANTQQTQAVEKQVSVCGGAVSGWR